MGGEPWVGIAPAVYRRDSWTVAQGFCEFNTTLLLLFTVCRPTFNFAIIERWRRRVSLLTVYGVLCCGRRRETDVETIFAIKPITISTALLLIT
jgi:hypothetical protein